MEKKGETTMGVVTLPTLYKLSSTGKVQEWSICYGPDVVGSRYTIKHGQVGGKIQSTTTLIEYGKNIGKSNETSALQQAGLEAHSLWKKQKDRKGYTETIPQEKPFRPMLAQKFIEHSDKIKFPALIQRKLDGCVEYNTVLITKEYGPMKIGDIVSNKIKCHVLSKSKAGKKEFKKVVYHFLNKENNESTKWFKITTDSGAELIVTGNHPVWLPELKVYRRVDELKGDEIIDFNR